MAIATRLHVNQDGSTTLAVTGEIDLAVAESLHETIVGAIGTAAASGLVIDLGQVTFLDSTGISALVRGYRAAGDHEVRYSVINAVGSVRQVLEITGVLELLANPASVLTATPAEEQRDRPS